MTRLDDEYDAEDQHDLATLGTVDPPARAMPGRWSVCACGWESTNFYTEADARDAHETHRDQMLGFAGRKR